MLYWLKEDKFRKVPPVVGLIVLLVCLTASPSWAVGTPAGTVISSTATVDFTLSGSSIPETISTTESFTVLEVIDAVLVWQDAAAVPVDTPYSDGRLSFLLTNTGNGPESFRLGYDQALAGDEFDPAVSSLWLETNGTEGLQAVGASPDTVYTPGLNDPMLAADADQLVYLLSDVPAGLNDSDTGRVQLTAVALTPGAAGAAAGTTLPGAGAGGIDAVVGATGADTDATGTYEVASVDVSLTKSIENIADTSGGHQPYPHAVVTYRIRVEVSGNGTAENLVISDPVPADMTFVPGSIVLDGIPQTDADDAPVDTSDFNITAAGAVTVNLGDSVAPATHIIDFEATIN